MSHRKVKFGDSDNSSLFSLLGLAVGGIAVYYLFIKPKPAVQQQHLQPMLSTGPVQPTTSKDTTASTIKTVTATAGAVAAVIPGVGTAIGGAIAVGGQIAATIYNLFSGKPLDPVKYILIAEMPFAYAGIDNVPPSSPVYALDRYGLLWPLSGDADTCGWLWRAVIAVNWKVFSMFTKSPTTICDPKSIEPMPRPNDAAVLRGTFGNDIRFKIGSSNDFRGPWENQDVTPIPGTPAEWGAIAGDYQPTLTASPGEY